MHTDKLLLVYFMTIPITIMAFVYTFTLWKIVPHKESKNKGTQSTNLHRSVSVPVNWKDWKKNCIGWIKISFINILV